MAKKHSKNLSKVQSYLDGTYGGKIKSGYTGKKSITRKIGDIWEDSDGVKWEQKNGYRSKLTKVNVGMFSKQCSTCKKAIIKPWDKDVFSATTRCYHCQLDFEVDIKTKPIRWFAWKRLKDLQNMEAVEKDFIQWLDELENMKQEKVFDKSVVNALANSNVEMSIKKNS